MSTAPATAKITALDPLALPLSGSRLIEASAGTGKTFTIALLYVRAVLGHGEGPAESRPLTPRELLVVTFTEAATKELRDRIRARLAEAADVFRQPEQAEPSADPLYQLRASYPDPERWPALARRLQLAAEAMDEASVHTIHGWCNRMLKEHAFDSGGLFNQNLETDQSELLAEVARDYWRSFVNALSAESAAMWLQVVPSPDDLANELLGLLPLRDQLPEIEDGPQSLLEREVAARREVFDAVRPGLEEVCDRFLALLEDAKKTKAFNGTKLRLANVGKWLDELKDWAGQGELVPPALTEAAWNRLTPDGLADAWKQGPVPDDHELVRRIGRLAEVRERPIPARALLLHACHWVAGRLEREKQRRAEMGFDDLLHRLDRALQGEGGARLAETIRRQFPLAMIDEFQDTDPVQYRIFDAVYRIADNHPETGFLMIGDPKQAIYAFRGADIFTYLRARQATAGRHVTLPRNFRSAVAMVTAANRVFDYAEAQHSRGAFLFRQGDSNPVPFLPVTARGREEVLEINGKPAPAMTFWTRDGDDNKGDALAETAEACASEMVRLLNLGRQGRAGFRSENDALIPLCSSDMAVLVNTGREATLVRDALDARGVKSVYLSDRASVLETPQARDLLYWLEACAEPERDALVRAALATATLDLPWATLEQLRNNELAWEAEIEHFRELHRIWRRQGVLPMLRRLLSRFGVPARWLARAEGERVLTDVLHLAELLQQESQQVDGEQSLIRRYSEMLAGHQRRAEALQVRLESDADLVQVVTVHKSKGLEYPLVFLPFATACRPAKGDRLPLQWHDDQGRRQLSFDVDDELLQRVDQERLGEDIRKLYVALTRARHATWVGAPALKGEENRSALAYLAGQAAGGDLAAALNAMARDCPEMAVGALPAIANDHYQPPPPSPLGPPRHPTRLAREDWWIASYSAIRYRAGERPGDDRLPPLPESETPQAERLREDAEPENQTLPPPIRQPRADTDRLHEFYRGAGPGTFLHGLLEWCAREGFANAVADDEGRRQMIDRRCQARDWQAWAEPLDRWLVDLLQSPLPVAVDGNDAEVRLSDLHTAIPEMEFWFASNDVDAAELDQTVRQHTLQGAAQTIRQRRPAADHLRLNGMLKGFIDLVFEYNGRFYVADYKSNVLGVGDTAYTREAMALAVAEKRYDLQYTLYLLALHRLLQLRLPDYDYDRHIGGAVYLFLRGNRSDSRGVFTERPPRQLIESLDRMFRPARPGTDGVMQQESLL